MKHRHIQTRHHATINHKKQSTCHNDKNSGNDARPDVSSGAPIRIARLFTLYSLLRLPGKEMKLHTLFK